jgi:hypothetical protein
MLKCVVADGGTKLIGRSRASDLGNVCYLSVQNLLRSSLLSKNIEIKAYRTLILPVILYGCETWSLTLRE